MLEKERKFVPLPIGNISENELRVNLLYIFFQKKKTIQKSYLNLLF